MILLFINRVCISLIVTIMLVGCSYTKTETGRTMSLEEYRELRKLKLNHPRPLIHNNDGNGVIYYPIGNKYSVKNLMDLRSSGLIETDVNTISYCTIASGFGNFTHNTQVGEILTSHGFEYGILNNSRNIMSEMLADGTDPLHEQVKFAHNNGMELFWSNRINDTHDASHRADKPYYLWTEYKENHPELLFGSIGEHLPYGRWSSVNFDHKEIRDRCVAFYKEVCENYEVDGVELDFLRHFELFKSVAQGSEASQQQLDKLTDMIREIRRVTEEVGRKKGSPILVLVRVPTSVDYMKKAGVDLIRWIEEGLVDIVVGSGYFQLDFWKNFVKLGNNNQVKIYAGLAESRVKNEHPLLVRQQNAVFRARAAAAWEAGVDGIYSFNEYNTRAQYLSEIGDHQTLNHTNNLYFVTYLDYAADMYLKDGNDYFVTPRLSPTPGNHRKLEAGKLSYSIELGDEKSPAQVCMPIWVHDVDPGDLTVSLNGNPGTYTSASDDGLLIYKINQSAVKPGINQLSLEYKGNSKTGEPTLKDAAIFFYRDQKDVEMLGLIGLCTP